MSLAANQVDACSPQPAPAGGAQLIGRALFGRGEFGHGRRDDVRQTPARRRRGGEAPGWPLVVHQPSRAVDGVDDHRPGVAGPDLNGLVEPFGDDHDVGPVLLEPLQQRVVRHPVDCVDGVGYRLPRHRGHVHAPGADDEVAHVLAERAEEPAGLLR